MEPKVISEEPLSMRDLKEEIEKIKKRDEDRELSIRVNKLDDYLNNFEVVSAETEKKLKSELEALKIPRLKLEHIIKIIDLLPRTDEELSLIMQSYALVITSANSEKILKVLKSV